MALSHTVTTFAWLAMTTLTNAVLVSETRTTPGCKQRTKQCICNELGMKNFDATSCSLDTSFLDLSSNNLLEIHANMFSTLIHLTTITLTNNTIFTIDKSAFGELINLEKIYLTNNKLTYIPRDLIRNNTNVIELDLNSNKILIPPCGPLLNSSSLKILHLESCDIDTLVEAEAFTALPSLERLELNGNPLQMVKASVFQNLQSRSELTVIKNDTIHCSESLKETIKQLSGRVEFIYICSIPSIKEKFDLTFFLAVATVITCVLVVILMVYLCVIHLSVHCGKRSQPLVEQVAQALQQAPHSFDGGYEQPSPRTEEDVICSLPLAPVPPIKCNIEYLRIISDDTPLQSPEMESEDEVFFNNIRPFEDSNRRFLEPPNLNPDVTQRSSPYQYFNTLSPVGGNELVSPDADGSSSSRRNETLTQPSVNTDVRKLIYRPLPKLPVAPKL